MLTWVFGAGISVHTFFNMSDKVLIAIQFWPGDKPQAQRLARLIADLQETHSDKADILFAARFDTEVDKDVLSYVSRKFDVHSMVSRRKGTGWPYGTTELVCSVLEWAYFNAVSKNTTKYKAVFTCEGDGVPLSADWISHFSAGWDALTDGTKVADALIEKGSDHPRHVNGNAFFSTDKDFLNWAVGKGLPSVPSQSAWDTVLAPEFEKRGWAALPGLESSWQTHTMEYAWYEREKERGTRWFHGVKDNSLYDQVQGDLLGVKRIKRIVKL